MDQIVRSPCILDADLSRAARAVLDWSLVEAGRRAGVSVASVLSADGHGTRSATEADAARLRRAYEEAGLEVFDGGAGRGLRIGPRRELPPG